MSGQPFEHSSGTFKPAKRPTKHFSFTEVHDKHLELLKKAEMKSPEKVKKVKNRRKSVKGGKGGKGAPKKWKANLLRRLAEGQDASYSKGYSFPHSVHSALQRSGIMDMLRELGADGVHKLRQESLDKDKEISKLSMQVSTRDRRIEILLYRLREMKAKKDKLVTAPTGELVSDMTEIERVMCVNLINQFRNQTTPAMFLNKLKFAAGKDLLEGFKGDAGNVFDQYK